jgi:hypothetical protein
MSFDKRMIVKLEAVNALAQLIAAIGVIVSLFYLAAQIRQNTRSMRAVVVDSLAHSLVDLLGPHAQNPESLRAFSVVNRKLGRRERRRPRTRGAFHLRDIQAFRKCVVPATPRHARSAARGWVGCLYLHLLSPARSKDAVDDAARSFCSRVPRLS